jgi:2-polyprenyl-6-methoxyphenol hydroxylase-like FAD-dependent oxidoreductase
VNIQQGSLAIAFLPTGCRSTMENIFDALIIGAGPAGSSAAILLAGAGWSVALIEKQSFPRRKVCGECIAASNLPLLSALRVGTEFERLAGPALRKVAFMRGVHTAITELPPATRSSFAWGRALGRETLDTLLMEKARAVGVQIFQPWSLSSIRGAQGAWRCELKAVGSQARATLCAPIAIDAHGSWESLPASRDERRRVHRATDLLAFKANFTDASLEDGLLPVLSFDGGYGGMVVADGRVMTLACCVRRDRLEALRHTAPGVSAGEAVEAMLMRECAGVRKTLSRATRPEAWIAAGPLHPGIRVHNDDGFFRIGNAAGEAHPIIGEGMSMALQSAWLLCAELLGAQREERSPTVGDAAWQHSAKRRYARQWHRRFGPRMRLASLFAHASMRAPTADALLMLFKAWPGLLQLGATWSGKTDCAVDAATIASLTTLRRTV